MGSPGLCPIGDDEGMPPRLSAGLLLYRHRGTGGVEVLLGHMGGPFWAAKDSAAWSIPKGEYVDGDDPLAAAKREFEEELGAPPRVTRYIPLGSVQQSSAKVVKAWAAEGDFDTARAVSNTFEMEWPKGSGQIAVFPEIDRAAWFDLDAARGKLVRGQVPLLDRLAGLLA